MSSHRVTFNLTCGEGVTDLQNLANLCLSSFAESHQMQQKNFDLSPKEDVFCYYRTKKLNTIIEMDGICQ